MRYEMKEQLFALGDDFTIRDETGREVFFVDGKAFTVGRQLSFQDMAGNELLFIRQRLMSWGPTFEILVGGQVAALIKKELFTFFTCRFTVDVPGPNDLTAEGDFLDHEYAVQRGDKVVATITKKWFSLGNTYGVEVAEGVDDILILAATVVIDMACQKNDRNQ